MKSVLGPRRNWSASKSQSSPRSADSRMTSLSKGRIAPPSALQIDASSLGAEPSTLFWTWRARSAWWRLRMVSASSRSFSAIQRTTWDVRLPSSAAAWSKLARIWMARPRQWSALVEPRPASMHSASARTMATSHSRQPRSGDQSSRRTASKRPLPSSSGPMMPRTSASHTVPRWERTAAQASRTSRRVEVTIAHPDQAMTFGISRARVFPVRGGARMIVQIRHRAWHTRRRSRVAWNPRKVRCQLRPCTAGSRWWRRHGRASRGGRWPPRGLGVPIRARWCGHQRHPAAATVSRTTVRT